MHDVEVQSNLFMCVQYAQPKGMFKMVYFSRNKLAAMVDKGSTVVSANIYTDFLTRVASLSIYIYVTGKSGKCTSACLYYSAETMQVVWNRHSFSELLCSHIIFAC